MQNHYNLIYREEEREMIPFCLDQGVGLIPWSPLARGFLAGKRPRETKGDTPRARTDTYAHSMYYRDDDYDVVDRLVEVAERAGAKPAQVALTWLLQRPGVTAPIIGASKMSHLEDAVAALAVKLGDEEVKALEAPYKPHLILGHE
jgi:aryl-alcohol dehydrogenase (NADP+)